MENKKINNNRLQDFKDYSQEIIDNAHDIIYWESLRELEGNGYKEPKARVVKQIRWGWRYTLTYGTMTRNPKPLKIEIEKVKEAEDCWKDE